jgi:ATP-dependent helicase/nuclease subunit B
MQTIPSHLPFLDTLAADILHQYGSDPLLLSNITILLPNRRSCKSLQQSFLRISDGKPLLLPTIQPIGEADDEQFIFKHTEIPNLISPTRQRLILTRLIEKWQSITKQDEKITTVQAAHLAIELASFLGEVEKEQLSFENIAKIVPDDLSRHWQITLDFLHILIDKWPEILLEKNAVDIHTQRNLTINMQAEYWQQNPPPYPVVIAGSTGSIPATANLIKTIAGLPSGRVILAGLDNHIDDASWDALSETHPQFGLKQLLEFVGVARGEISSLSLQGEGIQRSILSSELMRPAATTSLWKNLKLSSEALEGIELITTATLQEEATVIALILKETLHQQGKTAALITNNRDLARYVSAILQKWDVAIDDSAGNELSQTPQAIYLRLLAQMAMDKAASPISLLNCLKHPFAAGGISQGEFRNHVRKLELLALRGIRPSHGIASYYKILNKHDDKSLIAWLERLEKTIKPMLDLTKSNSVPFDEILLKHISVAEELANSDSESGGLRLWRDNAGEQLKDFLDELILPARNFKNIEPEEYPALLEALLVGQTYRPAYGNHPRISILSPIEARMQSFDVVIMGDLNEGSWPATGKSDPWMSRPMRSNFGLPLPEKKIGQSAHDFAQLFCSSRVVMTRSEKMDGTQTIPSRWLMRLSAVLKVLKCENAIAPKQPWTKWAALLNTPENFEQYQLPSPTPPLELRPQKLSVTAIEKLMRDPYSIYASKILQLYKLDEIDKEPGPLEFGNFVHEALDIFVKEYGDIAENERGDFLLGCGRKILREMELKPAVEAFWWPRFERIAAWFVENEATRRSDGAKIESEIQGEYKIGDFTLYAKADRIETDSDGNISIIDYKTGTVPAPGDIALGLSPQITLEGLIASKGGFSDFTEHEIKELLHWKLSGGAEITEEKTTKPELIKEAEEGLKSLINLFTNANTPYLPCPNADKAPKYNDYEHLERVKEWMD